jgi:hypothetical protein
LTVRRESADPFIQLKIGFTLTGESPELQAERIIAPSAARPPERRRRLCRLSTLRRSLRVRLVAVARRVNHHLV